MTFPTWALPAIDGTIALAFFAMVLALIRFMRMRRGAPLNRVYGVMAGAISLAGISHASLFWAGLNQAAQVVTGARLLEAIAAVSTAGILFTLLPRSVDPPGRAALMRSKAALERAEALAHFGSWQWDPVSNRVEWSAELYRIYGLEPHAFPATIEGYLARVHPDDRELVERTVREAYQQKLNFRLRERIVRPDGEVRVLSSAGDVTLDAQGNVSGMFGACHDVTDQERGDDERREIEGKRVALEQQFFQSQKLEAIGRLAGGIAHDFNNMLLVILGSVSLLLDRKKDDDPQWKDLRAIEDAAERAGGLTRQLLAVAKRQILSVSDVDLNSAIKDMEEMLRRSLGDDVRFVLSLTAEPLVVRADPSQLQQVLLNLAVNARDAMPGGGTLTIATRVDRDKAGSQIAVADITDTGVGMDEQVLGHLFEPFYTTKGSRGTGLGLATVYGIVTQSGGAIDVRSKPGAGTTFSVSLPRVLKAAPDTEERAGTGPLGGSETVLIVDDSEPVLSLTSRILNRAGYHVLTAPSGEWAISVAQRHASTIHLLLTDVMMPGMSGPQLARQLSTLRPSTRVMYMTGYQRASAEGESTIPPDAALIEKPFKPEALLKMVRKVLEAAV